MFMRRIIGAGRTIFCQKSISNKLKFEHVYTNKTSVLQHQAVGMATYKIREATILDAETIRNMLHEEFTNDLYSVVPQDEFKKYCFGDQRSLHPFVAEYFPGSGNDETGKSIAGCIIFSKMTNYYFGDQAYFQGMMIKPEHRGNNIAKRLQSAAIEYGLKHGCRTGFLFTRRDNAPAIKFVESFNGKVFMEEFCLIQMKDLQDLDLSSNS